MGFAAHGPGKLDDMVHNRRKVIVPAVILLGPVGIHIFYRARGKLNPVGDPIITFNQVLNRKDLVGNSPVLKRLIRTIPNLSFAMFPSLCSDAGGESGGTRRMSNAQVTALAADRALG